MKKYSIIYADPAWEFKNKKTGGGLSSGAESHYNTMNISEMKLLPIKNISDDNCILFMWWVASQPKEAIELVESWGFTIKTMTGFNWVKKTKHDKLDFGMGFWTRAGSEMCLIATKGKPKRISGSVRSVVIEKKQHHSKKPDVIRDLIVELIGDLPRVELFARDNFDGWDSWGNEVKQSITL